MQLRGKKTRLFWIEIVALAAGTACALALLLASLGAVAAVASNPKPAPPSQQQADQDPPPVHEAPQQARPTRQRTYEGMVTCSQCGARHSATSGQTAADCTRSCVHSGAQFALVEGEKTYRLEGDVALVKKLAGQRARIVGALKGNTITVSSGSVAS
ncbi:MAG: hypothetical protein WBQ08_18385 [Candidatus Sulfotelmatobacter sp.]